jgi:hypothetical protein
MNENRPTAGNLAAPPPAPAPMNPSLPGLTPPANPPAAQAQ